MQSGAAVLVKARDVPGLRSCSGGGQGSPGCLAQHLYPVLHPEQPAGDSGGWLGPGRRGGSSWGACVTASISQATSFSRWADASGLSQGGHTCPGKHVGSLLYYPRRQGQLGAGGRGTPAFPSSHGVAPACDQGLSGSVLQSSHLLPVV